jgi:uncharacterized Zn-finger protein
MKERVVSEWFLGVKCPYCNKTLSLTQEHVYVWASEMPHSWCVVAQCPYCSREFVLDFRFKG